MAANIRLFCSPTKRLPPWVQVGVSRLARKIVHAVKIVNIKTEKPATLPLRSNDRSRLKARPHTALVATRSVARKNRGSLTDTMVVVGCLDGRGLA